MVLAIGLPISSAQDAPKTAAAKTKESKKAAEQGSKKKNNASKKKQPMVDVAILLDTSNSMDGLIAQAQNQL
ncbi:MAG: hypothetical protein ACPHL6_05700, partial [Rubripirellula sp.]